MSLVKEFEGYALSEAMEGRVPMIYQVWLENRVAELERRIAERGEAVGYINKLAVDWLNNSDVNMVGSHLFKTGGENLVPVYTGPQVLEGWQIVPKEPTPEMLSAADREFEDINVMMQVSAWHAMLSAAPQGGVNNGR